MTNNLARVAYSVEEAATATSMSVSTIRRALRSTDPAAFPPPLRAKKAGLKGKLLIPATELSRWLESLPDA